MNVYGLATDSRIIIMADSTSTDGYFDKLNLDLWVKHIEERGKNKDVKPPWYAGYVSCSMDLLPFLKELRDLRKYHDKYVKTENELYDRYDRLRKGVLGVLEELRGSEREWMVTRLKLGLVDSRVQRLPESDLEVKG